MNFSHVKIYFLHCYCKTVIVSLIVQYKLTILQILHLMPPSSMNCLTFHASVFCSVLDVEMKANVRVSLVINFRHSL